MSTANNCNIKKAALKAAFFDVKLHVYSTDNRIGISRHELTNLPLF